MPGNLTIEALLTRICAQLRDGMDPESPDLDSELLLGHVLGMSRAQLRADAQKQIPEESEARIADLVRRRVAGEPLAYLLGHRGFWTLQLRVTAAVLVPRPETELLVERALALAPADEPVSFVDLGTGSGAIALAIAKERPSWRVMATDVSAEALAVARENARLHGAPAIEMRAGDWLQPLQQCRFRLIASTPPYIAEDDPALDQPVLKHEPRDALAGGPDGMSCLRRIVHDAPDHLEPGGWLLLEHGWEQATAVARELVVRGFSHVRSHRDLAGHARVTEAQWLRAQRERGNMIKFETSHGSFTVELFPKEAPASAENFTRYVEDGFFDGTIFHRIIPNFMIQGGGLTADFANKQTRPPIKNEAKNGLKNQRGTLAMARTSDINSATAQFFINLTDNGFLDNGPRDYGYAVFGRVTEGMDTVDKIAAVKTGRRKGYQDAPLDDVTIISARKVDS